MFMILKVCISRSFDKNKMYDVSVRGSACVFR